MDWLIALTNSIVHGQPPLNQGTRYAFVVTGELAGDVRGPSLIGPDTAMGD